ncbi:UNVERIFIED_CONTAM: hypothetical protein Sradi_0248100 [Sesamum radiatum]|uniref:Uncharacterized protein n=1 Tax=Sesamum radiatum TaxID=300843 RepID=A0AAW2W0N7_SESRA
MSSYSLIFGKPCNLSIELEHRDFWAIKQLNMTMDEAGCQRKLQLQELEEIRNDAYENSRIYKDETKNFHDHAISRKVFIVGQKCYFSTPNSNLSRVNGHRLKPFYEDFQAPATEKIQLMEPTIT